MKKRVSMIIIASACAVILTSTAVLTPKAVRAAVATLIRDQDNAARHPLAVLCEANPNPSCSYTVPQGMEYVIQQVSVQDGSTINTGDTNWSLQIGLTTGGQQIVYTASPGTIIHIPSRLGAPAFEQIAGAVPTTLYADPGTQITLSVQYLPSTVYTTTPIFWISGYYVSLP